MHYALALCAICPLGRNLTNNTLLTGCRGWYVQTALDQQTLTTRTPYLTNCLLADEDDEENDNGEEAISLDNVMGRRTRGKVIDFAKAAEENPDLADDDEDDDDEDFEEEDDKMDED